MTAAEAARYALAAATTAMLAWAAVSDVRSRRIPNLAVLALLALFVLWLVAGGGGAVSALEAGGLALAATVALWLLGLIGAGDSKLFACAALFMGMGYLPWFALATALAGGVIAIGSLALRPTRTLVLAQMGTRGDWGRGIPYGAAISFAAALILWTNLIGVVGPFGHARPPSLQQLEKAVRPISARP
ncbi:MAG TPA: prepilin peptidase [Caulobacteraceae bacterium]|nr:prepilin peptidase [Caulobacteraceae bacterium]